MIKWTEFRNFMSGYMDSYNFFEYRRYENKKCCYPKRTNQEIMSSSSNTRKRHKHPTAIQWGRHISEQSILGYCNRQNDAEWLVMLDFDSFKDDPDRSELLNQSATLVRQSLGKDFYLEKSTFTNDLHGYIKVKREHGFLMSCCLIDSLIEVLDSRCVNIGLKALEVMGLPYFYQWDNGRIIKVIGSTPAKIPVEINRFQELKQTETITTTEIQSFLKLNQTNPIQPQWGEVECLEINQSKFPDGSVSFTPFTREDLEVKLLTIWDKATNSLKFQYNDRSWISREDWLNYALSWMLATYRSTNEYDESRPWLRHTVPVKSIQTYYHKISGNRKHSWNAQQWVGTQLEALGALICVNRGYIVGGEGKGIARRWKCRISAIDAILKRDKTVSFAKAQVRGMIGADQGGSEGT